MRPGAPYGPKPWRWGRNRRASARIDRDTPPPEGPHLKAFHGENRRCRQPLLSPQGTADSELGPDLGPNAASLAGSGSLDSAAGEVPSRSFTRARYSSRRLSVEVMPLRKHRDLALRPAHLSGGLRRDDSVRSPSRARDWPRRSSAPRNSGDRCGGPRRQPVGKEGVPPVDSGCDHRLDRAAN
jgi:hypothetical protein